MKQSGNPPGNSNGNSGSDQGRKGGRKSQGPPPGFEPKLTVNTNAPMVPIVPITYKGSILFDFEGNPIRGNPIHYQQYPQYPQYHYQPHYPPVYQPHYPPAYAPRSPRNSPVVVYHHGPPVQHNRSVVSPNGSPNSSPNGSPKNNRNKIVVNSKASKISNTAMSASDFDHIYGCFETCPNSKGRQANYGIVEKCCTDSFNIDIKTSGIVREFIVSIGAHGSNNLFFPSDART
jgi:hypothetical protein